MYCFLSNDKAMGWRNGSKVKRALWALFPGPRSESSQRPVALTPGRYQRLPSVGTSTHVTQHIHNGMTFSHLRLDSSYGDGTGPCVKDEYPIILFILRHEKS